jgi:hypothetical protein
MDKMDLDAIGTLHAVRYPIHGETATWVIDGAHRLTALLKLGMGEWPVEVMLHLDCTDDKRASELFLRLNDRTLVSPLDRFRNQLQAGDLTAIGVNATVIKHGYRIGPATTNNIMACVKALTTTWGLDSGRSLDLALSVIQGAWGKSATGNDGKIIEGIGRFIHDYANIDSPALTTKLAKRAGGPARLIGDARNLNQTMGGSLPKQVQAIVAELYTRGRKA